MKAALAELAAIHRGAKAWAIEKALPLWSASGFSRADGAFEEQLGFDFRPVSHSPRRAMVQARQIAVFSSAALEGCFKPGGELAQIAAGNLLRRYWAADGKPGFVFSVAPDGSVLSDKRDLYTHAFVLFALAWLQRLEASDSMKAEIERTMLFVREAFPAQDGEGFVDSIPRSDNLRRQNPHMHLFEAAIELFEATGSPASAALAADIRALASKRYIRKDTGALLEYFTEDWRRDDAAGAPARSEPGHQMEWAWLLRRHEEVSGIAGDGKAEALIDFALRTGIDRTSGRVIDEVDDAGRPTKSSSRCWPHTETIKALVRQGGSSGDASRIALAAKVYSRLMTQYCSAELNGGWKDQLDEHDRPVSKFMPASTLYHVYFAIREVDQSLRRHGIA